MKMSTDSERAPGERPDHGSLLRWVFIRGTKLLTCEVSVTGAGSYDVCVVPHWNVGDSVIEAHERSATAMRRHAEIAWGFRQAGWTLVRDAGHMSPLRAA